jgi:hydrogenase maturation protease
MNRMLVIGIGSLLMTDDGIGARVAEAIERKLQDYGIDVLVGETDVQYCLNEILPEDFLVILDAVIQGKAPGSIEIIPLRDAARNHGKLRSQHDFSLIDAISLHYPDIKGCLIGIEAAELAFGFDLSEALRNRFDFICNQVLDAVIDMKEATRHA